MSLHLSDRYHVYALDQRGHDDSEWVRDQGYAPGPVATDALGFIEQQGIESPIIMGHLRRRRGLAIREPYLPRALVFVDVGPSIDATSEVLKRYATSSPRNVEFDAIEDFVHVCRAMTRSARAST